MPQVQKRGYVYSLNVWLQASKDECELPPLQYEVRKRTRLFLRGDVCELCDERSRNDFCGGINLSLYRKPGKSGAVYVRVVSIGIPSVAVQLPIFKNYFTLQAHTRFTFQSKDESGFISAAYINIRPRPQSLHYVRSFQKLPGQ
jgi:hypothetical protein